MSNKLTGRYHSDINKNKNVNIKAIRQQLLIVNCLLQNLSSTYTQCFVFNQFRKPLSLHV